MPSDVIQWFPGHMAKTRRLIKENLSKVDVVLNVLDARIPQSSRNPEITRLVAGKPMLNVLSKYTLADPDVSAKWKKYYGESGENCVFIDSVTGYGIKDLLPKIRETVSDKIEKYEAKGMSGRAVRAMIVGIPNSGKSSLINRLAGSKKAKVENRPGVTLTNQWVNTSIGLDLMDMPGVLWPKFDDRKTGENLAITGAIKDQVVVVEDLAVALVDRLRKVCPGKLGERYKLGESDLDASLENWQVAENIGRKRGFLVAGGEVDFLRTANMLLEEFRSGKIGRITLEAPPSK